MFGKFVSTRLIMPIQNEINRGLSLHEVSLCISLGLVIALCPILGVTTGICAIFAYLLKLNQVVIQIVNYACYPIQIICFLPFIKMGQMIFQPNTNLPNLDTMLTTLENSPVEFFSQFSAQILYGAIAWMGVAILILPLSYLGLHFGLKKFGLK